MVDPAAQVLQLGSYGGPNLGHDILMPLKQWQIVPVKAFLLRIKTKDAEKVAKELLSYPNV